MIGCLPCHDSRAAPLRDDNDCVRAATLDAIVVVKRALALQILRRGGLLSTSFARHSLAPCQCQLGGFVFTLMPHMNWTNDDDEIAENASEFAHSAQ